MKKYLNFIVMVTIFVPITCCSSYKQHLGGKSYEYKNAKIENSLESNSKQFPLIKSSRYSIPAIPGKWTGPVDHMLPIEENSNNNSNKT